MQWLEAFQQSRFGLFVKKIMDDRAPNLAALLAWGTLSAILPLLLGVLSIAGLILRDPQRLDQVYSALLVLLPAEAVQPVSTALQGVRQTPAAGPAGIVALVLLLVNGSSFFGNIASVFDQAYHVPDRNFVVQRLLAILMLCVTTILMLLATFVAGVTSVVGNVSLFLPIGGALAQAIGWSVSIVSVFLFFLGISKVLPNARQSWRDVLPGAALSTVLLLLISQIFPLYVTLFPPNHAYAVFGVFLVLTFWLYLLGWDFVLGAELNAFLQQPARSVALAEATAAALQGKATYDLHAGDVRAEATGSAPALQGSGALGATGRSAASQIAYQRQGPDSARQPAVRSVRPSLAGRLLGLVGLLVAALLLRGQMSNTTKPAKA